MKMPKRVLTIFIGLVLLASANAMEAKPKNQKSLQSRIDKIIAQSGLKQSDVGLYVFNDQHTLYAKQEHKELNPASAIKILVTAAALDHWGQAYTFKTKLWLNENKLCIQGGLDPYFVTENLWLLAQMLRRESSIGIDTLIIDNSKLSVRNALKKNFSGDAHRAFVAPQSALALNFNALNAYVYPAKRKGQLAKVVLDPDLPKDAYSLKSTVKTVSSAGRKSAKLQVSFDESSQKLLINLSGTVGINEKRRVLYGSVPKPDFYAVQALKSMLGKENILAEDKAISVQYAACSGAGKSLEFESKPLTHIVWGMNKYSNNFMAEMLFFALAKEGVDIQQWLKQYSAELKDKVLIEKASGLSRNTKISAHDLAKLFSIFSKHPIFGTEFLHAMSVANQDGTLKRRFKQKSLSGKVRAKSGTLSNVTALVGQAATQKYGTVHFSFLWNNTGKAAWQLRALEEKILSELY